MIDIEFVREFLGEEAVEHFSLKLQGDDNSDRGRRFELTAVMFEVLARALACRPDSRCPGDPTRVFITQGGSAFVDDIIVEREFVNHYIQCKLVGRLYWSTDSLYLDFFYMHLLGLHHPKRTTSTLVTGYQPQVQRLRDSRSDFDIETTPVRYVANDRNLPRLAPRLPLLCNILMDAGTLEDMIRHVEAAWMDLGRSASLSQVMWRAHTLSRGLVKSLLPNPPDLTVAIEYLNNIDGLRVSADANTITVSFTKANIKMQGKQYEFNWDGLEHEFHRAPPKTAEEFWTMCVML